MKRLLAATLSLTLLAATGSAFAAPLHHDDRDRHDQRDDRNQGPSRGHERHDPPRRGGHLAKDHRGAYVSDYKRHGLHAPKRGQQWRKVDDRYVLIAVASGLIADVVLNGR
ncbi:RcnB family protein [Stenotrophomonas sp. ISL-67]|uniref:RcnB family protein n=1 Tax=Stenotrophomonas sp. ISL-67 TaxID=2819171 RepID=UPI001BEBDACE|nr:RcnB family protein [Stenotrophomonas sp. ISL-67]MBT2766481.1 RcnB family protein [Stenotrophomonas sp. ISL-67]